MSIFNKIEMIALIVVSAITSPTTFAADYLVNPGDVLQVSVWKEADLTLVLTVRPDGKINFPLAGELQAGGRSVTSIQTEIKARIDKYVPDAVVTVMTKEISGNIAYVVGKVNHPGPILMVRETNILQALAQAGGTAQFAKLKDIVVIRGVATKQISIPFDYDAVLDGKKLEKNISLLPGDTVAVP